MKNWYLCGALLFALFSIMACSDDDGNGGQPEPKPAVKTEILVNGLAGQTVSVTTTDGQTIDMTFAADGKALLETEGEEAPVYTLMKIGEQNVRIGRKGGSTITFDYVDGKVAQRTAEDGTVQVGIVEELGLIMDSANPEELLAKSYVQEADLYFDGVTDWIPIGKDYSLPFTGSYDGKDYKIYNLNIVGVAEEGQVVQYTGFFGAINNATLSNITIASGEVKGYRYTAALAARAQGTGEIVNCKNYATVIGEETVTGGLVAQLMGITIKESLNYGRVEGRSEVGGIVATAQGGQEGIVVCENHGEVYAATGPVGGIVGNANTNVTECKNMGLVNGNISVGGIAGSYSGRGSKLSKCSNAGEVMARAQSVGGIVGSVGYGTIEECTNEGTIVAAPQENEKGELVNTESLGGIVGSVTEGGLVQNCTNLENSVFNVGTSHAVGGIAGYMRKGEIKGCINQCQITAEGENTGGIVGFCWGTAEQCTNEAAITGRRFVGGIAGFTEEGYGKVRACQNNGAVKGTEDFVGGITGIAWGVVSASRNNAAVEGGPYTGGICGAVAGNYAWLLASSNFGEVKGSDNVGGVVGEMRQNALVEASYSVANVSGEQNVGGVCGVIDDSSQLLSCYWSGTNQLSVASGTGAEMTVAYFNDGTAVPEGVVAGWPSATENKNWGVGDGTNSNWWRDLGTEGKADYPALFWELSAEQ